MGYVLAHSPCITCGRMFAYNPHAVPSTTALTGRREPVCQRCMALINGKRREKGLAPFPIRPDAYEPLPEEEL